MLSEEYHRLRVLWPDHLGLARGKYLPRDYAERTNHCITLFALGYDRDMTPNPGSYFFEGMPDCEAVYDISEARKGWEEGTAVAVADIFKDGKPVELAPRTVLQRAVADWEELGFTPQVGFEFEAFLFEPDGDGGWIPIDTPGAYVYGTGTAVDPAGVFDDVMVACDEVGIPLEAINSEYDNGQFELTIAYGDATEAADHAFLFKVMAREIAHRKGYLCTFMDKPIPDRGGSGTHVNLSLAKDGVNLFVDESASDGISDLAKRCIAGLVAHHEGMAAIQAPTVNSYRRLRPGQLSGYWANWGYDHRGVAVRVPPDRDARTRLEHRLGGASCTPHQAAAATLQAARLGYVNELDPPEAETQDCLENVSTDRSVARDFAAALDELEADKEFVEAFSPDFVAAFTVIKRAEWERFRGYTTDWELNEYLHFL
ncbi:MAG: glutamine synthetase family protein [Acidimicrobiia bacterium]